jgi:hypothetical protein
VQGPRHLQLGQAGLALGGEVEDDVRPVLAQQGADPATVADVEVPVPHPGHGVGRLGQRRADQFGGPQVGELAQQHRAETAAAAGDEDPPVAHRRPYQVRRQADGSLANGQIAAQFLAAVRFLLQQLPGQPGELMEVGRAQVLLSWWDVVPHAVQQLCHACHPSLQCPWGAEHCWKRKRSFVDQTTPQLPCLQV